MRCLFSRPWSGLNNFASLAGEVYGLESLALGRFSEISMGASQVAKGHGQMQPANPRPRIADAMAPSTRL